MTGSGNKKPHEASFGIRSAGDFFEVIVEPQYNEFLGDNASARHALQAITFAYHLHEWAYGSEFSKATPVADTAVKELFELARKIVNGTKHFEPKLITTKGGGFSNDFSDDFRRPLNVQKADETWVSADRLLAGMMDHWHAEKLRGVF
jgi:hypothetical protein